MTKYIPLSDFAKVYKGLVDKPREKTGETDEFMHTLGISKASQFNKGADYVVIERYNGGVIMQAYRGDEPQNGDWAVMLKGKPMTFCSSLAEARKIIDTAVKAVDTSSAGKVPNSLLARQDLEGTEKVQKHHLEAEIKDEVEGEAHYHALADKYPEHAEEFEGMAADEHGHKENLEEMETTKANPQLVTLVRAMKAKGYLRMNILAELSGDYQEVEIRAAIDEVFKGAVETTGKQLNEALKDAPNADTRMERKSLAENIVDIQLKRQKATIQARANESSGKSFKSVWKGLGDNRK
jgi:hypothetical protein